MCGVECQLQVALPTLDGCGLSTFVEIPRLLSRLCCALEWSSRHTLPGSLKMLIETAQAIPNAFPHALACKLVMALGR